MYISYVLKIIADIAFYFSLTHFLVAGAFDIPSNMAAVSLALFTLCAAVSIVLCNRCGNKRLRYIPLLLLAGNFLFVPFNIAWLVFIFPPTVYSVYNVATLRNEDGQHDYTRPFLWFVRIYSPLVIVFMLIAAIRPYLQAYSIPFALIFLASSVALMRMSKHSAEVNSRRSFRLANALTLGVVFLVGVAASAPRVVTFVRAVVARVFYDGLYSAFLYVMGFILFLLGRLLSLLPDITPFEEEGAEMPIQPAGMGTAPTETEPSIVFIVIIVTIAAVVILFLILLLFRQLSKVKPFATATHNAHIYEQRLPVYEKNKKSPAPPHALRRVFRRFIHLCIKQGAPANTYAASIDYTNHATTRFDLTDEAQQLRALYLPLRYGDKHPGNKDVSAARGLYKRIKAKVK